MLILNFSHPLTPEQLRRVEELAAQKVERVMDIKTQFDHERSFVEQPKELVDSIGLSPEEWQTIPLMVNPPSLSIIAAVVMAELHGRMGYFPAVIRLKPVADTTPPRFDVAEIINLQTVREAARAAR